MVADVDLQAVGDEELDGVDVAAEVQRCVALVVGGEQVGAELVQQAADVDVAAGGGHMKAAAAPRVADVGVEAALQQPLGVCDVAVHAGL